MDLNIVTYLACICFIFLIGRIFIVPIKKILKLILNSIFGGIIIYVINLIGANFGFHIGLNIINSIIIGLLGLPGAVCLIIVKLLVGWWRIIKKEKISSFLKKFLRILSMKRQE